MHVPEEIKKQLKDPLGKVYITVTDILKDYPEHKIVAVGDQSVLAFLDKGKKPFISVFDFRTLRKGIEESEQNILEDNFPNPLVVANEPSTLSEELFKVVPKILEKGGALRIEGEEDLTALVFLYFAEGDILIVYGQPKEGLVVVEPNKIKDKIRKMIETIRHPSP